MAVNKSKNNPSVQRRGNPGDVGQDKSQIKNVKGDKTELNYKEEIRDKYLKDSDNDQPVSHLERNPNRNTDKVDIDKHTNS